MFSGRRLLLIATGAIAIILAITGGLIYPLAGGDIGSILIYEIIVILGILGILLLIDNRGLEES
ncbi:MAG: hypothetical protein ACFFED_01930 [Candidatus Thorarchaeota archaeon]